MVSQTMSRTLFVSAIFLALVAQPAAGFALAAAKKLRQARKSSAPLPLPVRDQVTAHASVLAAFHAAAANPALLNSMKPAEAAALEKQLSLLSVALGDRGEVHTADPPYSEGSVANWASVSISEKAKELSYAAYGGGLTAPKNMGTDSDSPKHKSSKANDYAKNHGFDFQSIKMSSLTPFLIVCAILAVIGSITFEMVHYRWATADLSIELEYGNEEHTNQFSKMLAGVKPLITPFFTPQEENNLSVSNNNAWRYLIAIVCMALIELAFGLLFMLWMKEFWNALEKKQADLFMELMKQFLILGVCTILVGTYHNYLNMMMSIHWRQWLTEFLMQKWLAHKAFYHLQLTDVGGKSLDNPDQRLAEDVPRFIAGTMTLTVGFLKSVGGLITTLPVLIIMSPDYAFGIWYCPGWLVYLAMIYSVFGTVCSHLIGQKLINISFVEQKYNADFRYGIVQVRDHAESIALYGSEEVEASKMMEKFQWMVRTTWVHMKYSKRLGFFQSFYGTTSGTFPYLVLAPNYFKGQITLGDMFLLFAALGSVKGAFDWLIGAYASLCDYRATVDRLSNFLHAVDTPKQTFNMEMLEKPPAGSPPDSVCVAKDLCISLPGALGRKIWNNADFVVKPGQFVLLSAPEGSGKSCFFRAMAGIWPHASGSVFMDDTKLFLPQRPYIPQGTLKQAVAYPDLAENRTDEEVRAVLDVVRLDAVQNRALTDDANWEMSLSGGEQQRLAIAHAVLHRPKVLFLDEATSAMSEEGTLEMYSLLRREGTLPEGAAVISISHDLNLLEAVHDVHYRYDPDTSGWKLVEMKA